MTKLSVNINKIATLRNARGGNVPDVVKVALDCERFGAQGITVHPRPDERHIRYSDVRSLKPVLKTEFNINTLTHNKNKQTIINRVCIRAILKIDENQKHKETRILQHENQVANLLLHQCEMRISS
ncbi:MAG: pyridoxine 5'-phosphate synthase, partial [Bacteroidota bacterium]